MPNSSIPCQPVWTRLAREEVFSEQQLQSLQRELDSQETTEETLRSLLVRPDRLTRFQYDRLIAGKRLRLGPYLLRSQLGRGGMGRVFLGYHPMLQRETAIKVLRNATIDDEGERADALLRRFQREMALLAKLRHPRIVTAYDAGLQDGDLYLAMEYVEGSNLRQRVDAEGPPPVATACRYLAQALEALQYAHDNGLVHRDIKPSNLIATDSGIKLLDLGLANLIHETAEHSQLTETGGVLGTPDFLAPEQARDARHVGPAADLYGAGATLYFLLTGEPPFPGGSLTEKILKHQTQSVSPPSRLNASVPRGLDQIVLKLMDKNPSKRYATARQAAEALSDFFKGNCSAAANRDTLPNIKISDTAVSIPRPVRPKTAAKIKPVAYAAAALLLLLAGGVYWGPRSPQLPQPTPDGIPKGAPRGDRHSTDSKNAAVPPQVNPEVSRPSVLTQQDANVFSDAAEPYVVDAAFLSSSNTSTGTTASQPVAFAWADWQSHSGPSSILIRDVIGDSFSIGLPTTGPVKALAMHPTRPLLAAAGGHYNLKADGSIYLWDVSNPRWPQLIRQFAVGEPANADLQWIADDQLLTVRGTDSERPSPLVRIWNSDQGVAVDEAIWSSQAGTRVVYLADHRWLFIGQWPGKLSLWEIDGWKSVWSDQVTQSNLYDFAVTADERHILIATGSNDGTPSAILQFDTELHRLTTRHISEREILDIALLNSDSEIRWITAFGERFQADLQATSQQRLAPIASFESTRGWNWFERRASDLSLSVTGGSGSHVTVFQADHAVRKLNLANRFHVEPLPTGVTHQSPSDTP